MDRARPGRAGPGRRLPRGTAELSFQSPGRSTNIEEGESPPWGCLNMPFHVCVCRTNRGMLQSGEAALWAAIACDSSHVALLDCHGGHTKYSTFLSC